MNLLYVLSACAFALYVVIVLIRARMLRRRGIRVIVFGETDKSDFLLVPLVLLMAYAVLANAFGLPLWQPLLRPFWAGDILGWIGLLLCVLSMAGLVWALRSFGTSFRVGIDQQKPGELITTGMFGLSRNPIYVCFLLFFLGQFLIHRNLLLGVCSLAFALVIHRQVLREEAFLRAHYGAAYAAYCQKVRRYL